MSARIGDDSAVEYPIEGVTGPVNFDHVPNTLDWRLERREVRER